ncbi:hypothetical protein [Phosphitispora fastidiosa]|uniref:hypothetical protein n=1 Tax=Phosphitispora fastidiosa TaxID=2837202 RepID=UPI001E624651|nr:hypothetical protein [Phosphitispora fastidiosa]MBU7007698.1 phosphosulfolactate phosphohydrolase-like enzyme [Phosphitispora fastidiosa]
MSNSGVFLTVNASGAVKAAEAKNVVMVVDVIDMSTTLEAALDAGALRVFGASPDASRAPVKLSPETIGEMAGRAAREAGTGVIIISEPRVGTEEERRARAGRTIRGVLSTGALIDAVYPNIGAETTKLGEFSGKVVVAVTDTGGVAYDAAVTAGAPAVITGTIARTIKKRGSEPARAAAKRAVAAAEQAGTGISVVAASANSLEDILAAEYIMRLIIEEGFIALGK